MREPQPPRPPLQPRFPSQRKRRRMRRRERRVECDAPVTQHREEAETPPRIAFIARIIALLPATDAREEDGEGVETDEGAECEEQPGSQEPGCAEAGDVVWAEGTFVGLFDQTGGVWRHICKSISLTLALLDIYEGERWLYGVCTVVMMSGSTYVWSRR